jgi:hypothetical protein
MYCASRARTCICIVLAGPEHVYVLCLQGLNVLANTCHPDTMEWYTRYTDHVACAALENEETVAVVNRR